MFLSWLPAVVWDSPKSHGLKGPIFTALFPPQHSDISVNYKDTDWIINHDVTVGAEKVLDCTPTEDLTFNLTRNVSVFYP